MAMYWLRSNEAGSATEAALMLPRSAMRFELLARNSYTEAVRLLALMRKEGWRTLIVVSDPPHMRRLSWMYADVFEGSGLDYVLVASRPE